MFLGEPERKPIPKMTKELLYDKQKGKCNYCGAKLGIHYLHIDHKKPVARGGSNSITNFQLICGPCNTRKGKLTDGEFRRKYSLAGSRSAKKPPSRTLSQKRFDDITKKKATAKAKRKRRESSWF